MSNPEPSALSFLSVGTQILSKDLMDQCIRSLGNYRTHYALNGEAALRQLESQQTDVLITEFELSDMSAFQMIRRMRASQERLVYLILAVEEDNEELHHIALELEVDGVLTKPFTAKDIKAQVEIFEKKRADKHSLSSILLQAQIAFGKKDYPKSDKLYSLALQLAPGDSKVQYKAGLHFMTKPDMKSAEKHLRRAVELEPKSAAGISALGVLELKSGNYRLANDHFLEAQKLSPLNPERPIFAAKTRVEWAAEDLKKALMKHPDDSSLQFEFGRLLVLQHDFTQAVHVLKKIKIQDPHHREAQLMLQVAAKLGSINLN